MPAYRLTSDSSRLAGLLLAACIVGGAASPASAAETLRVLAAGAAQGAVLRLKPAIADASRAKLDAVFDTVGALRDRVLRGDVADVVILSEAGLAALEKAGKIAAGPVADLGSISVALAVRKGARVPDVGSPEAFKRALLSAVSIAHPTRRAEQRLGHTSCACSNGWGSRSRSGPR